MLRRAQYAILNPLVPPKRILMTPAKDLKDIPSRGGLAFSRNIICLDITGKDVVNLSFVDLPGELLFIQSLPSLTFIYYQV